MIFDTTVFERDSPIFNEKRQLAVRIPAKIVNELGIDEKKDYIRWTLIKKDKDSIELKLNLIKNGK